MRCFLLLVILSGFSANSPAEESSRENESDSVPAVVPAPLTSLAFTPEGRQLVACSQAGVQIHDWPDLHLRETLQVDFRNLHDVAFSPGGDRLAVSGGNPATSGEVTVFSWPDRVPIRTVRIHTDLVTATVWRDARHLFSGSLDHRVTLWSLESGAPLRRLDGHSRGVTALCFLPDAATLISAGIDQSLRVWEADSGKLLRSSSQHTAAVHALALRPPRSGLPMVASAGKDRTVRFWQPTIGRMVRSARLDAEPLSIAWRHDGAGIVAACQDGRLRFIDAETVKVTGTVPGVPRWAYAVAVHPSDGSVAVGGSRGELRRVLSTGSDETRDEAGSQ